MYSIFGLEGGARDKGVFEHVCPLPFRYPLFVLVLYWCGVVFGYILYGLLHLPSPL